MPALPLYGNLFSDRLRAGIYFLRNLRPDFYRLAGRHRLVTREYERDGF